MFGISREQVDQLIGVLAQRLAEKDQELSKGDRRGVHSSLAAMATGVTWEQLQDMQPLWTDTPVEKRTLRRDFETTYALFKKAQLMDPTIRFQHQHPCFPKVTLLVDGVAIPVRVRRTEVTHDEEGAVARRIDRNYSGKHREVCVKLEVWCTMNGIPVHVKGPFEGRAHDARNYASGDLLPHLEGELFLADLGYQGCAHCIVPYKKQRGVDVPERERWFNARHGLIRSRIERLFSFLHKFRVFKGADRCEDWVFKAMYIALSIFFCLYSNAPQYDDCRPMPVRPFGGQCACGNPPDVTRQRALIHNCMMRNAMEYDPKPPTKRKHPDSDEE